MGVYFPCPLQTHQAPPEDDRPKIYECNDCGEDIRDGDGYYIVAEQGDRGDDYLALNDIIVTSGENLYHGKVYQ